MSICFGIICLGLSNPVLRVSNDSFLFLYQSHPNVLLWHTFRKCVFPLLILCGRWIFKSSFFIVIYSVVITGFLLILIYFQGLEFKYRVSQLIDLYFTVYIYFSTCQRDSCFIYTWWAFPYKSVQPFVEINVSELCEIETIFHFCYKGMEWYLICSNSFKVSNSSRCLRNVKPVLKAVLL